MVKEIKTYECELCESEYDTRERAEACEKWGEPDSPRWVKIGEEIMLKNREPKTYTVAKVMDYKIANPAIDLGIDPLDYQHNPHEWLIELAEPVCLDHKWEESYDWVLLDTYGIKPGEVGDRIRKDNAHGG
jgi:hypothetical protein